MGEATWDAVSPTLDESTRLDNCRPPSAAEVSPPTREAREAQSQVTLTHVDTKHVQQEFLSAKVRMQRDYRSSLPRNVMADRVLSCCPRRLHFNGLERFVSRNAFLSGVALLILANSTSIAVEAECDLRAALGRSKSLLCADQMTEFLTNIEYFFAAAFACELCLRLVALECAFFFSKDGSWNILDGLLVVTTLAAIGLEGTGLDVSYVRLLRLSRVVRTLRVVRTVSFLYKFRAMLNAIASSIPSLVWALALIGSITFLFAIFITQGIATYSNLDPTDRTNEQVNALHTFFGSTNMTLLTLFMSITGGISWWELEDVLLDVHVIYGLMFPVFISVMVLVCLNVITGIFVNDALEMAQRDREMVQRHERDLRNHHIETLREIFTLLDKDKSGSVTLDEFLKQVERPDISATFTSLDVDKSDAVSLFRALDIDQSEELDIEEFVMGCMTLRGNARSFEGFLLRREMKKVGVQMKKDAREVHKELKHIGAIVERFPHSLISTLRVNASHSDAVVKF